MMLFAPVPGHIALRLSDTSELLNNILCNYGLLAGVNDVICIRKINIGRGVSLY